MDKMIPSILKRPLAFLKKDLQNDMSYRFSFVSRWAGVVISIFMFYYLSKLIGGGSEAHLKTYGEEYFPFVLIGLATISYLNANVSGYVGSVLGEQRMGALEVFLATPTSLPLILFSFSLYNVIMGLLAALLHILLGGMLGVDFSHINFIAVMVILILGTIIFLSLGIMASSCLLIFKRGDPITWMVTNLFWILGGAYFPVSIFPESLQKISACIPSTYIFHSLRLAMLKNYSLGLLKEDITVLSIFAVLTALCGYLASKAAIFYTRKRGTITFY